ncbi:ATP-binding cassette domain-containing protein [Bombiscardovia coagulans]|uniref:ABC transporter ATP-binding protein n=1 Tax=Bombiscardovia coagulans TaxID=686666 RepID=A0A261EQF2_9BIFI|nr:ATP-binding cassette domain-containing protein [Bombiscardovia coagulans]OZG49088.1 ABC transporter ATP-binding protein [Bombiscardovia coagulans]
MISKELLKLPGTDLRRSILMGILQAIGSLAEILLLLIAFFGLTQIFGIIPPSWIALFTLDPVTTIIWLLSLTAIKALSDMIANQTSLSISDQLSAELSSDLYQSLFNTQQAVVDIPKGREETSDQSMAMLSTEGIKSISDYFTTFLPTLIQSLLMIVVAALVLIPLNWAAGLIIMLGMLLLPLSANMMRSKQVAEQVAHLKKYNHIGIRFEEALRGLTTLKIFHADQSEADKLSEDSEGFRKVTMKLLAGQLRSLIGSDGVIYLSTILATLVTIFMDRMNPLNMLTAIVVAIVGIRLFGPERQMVYYTHAATVAIKQGKAVAAVRADLSSKQTTAEHTGDSQFDTTQSIATNGEFENTQILSTGVALNNLSFSYPSGFQALEDITLDLPTTGHYGLVGASGSGKSTLTSLLAGRLPGYEGSLTIDGKEVSGLAQEQLISLITVVKGSDHLFAGTVRSNLDPAGLEYSNEDLTRVLLETDLQELLDERGGLDSPIEQSGANLSGGQRQRLIIARALLRHSPIYIFDEATSAVDREHDQSLAALMNKLSKEALVITITHRLASVRQADCIFMLDKGHIIQSGSFEQLTLQPGLFAQQWQEQNRLEQLSSQGQPFTAISASTRSNTTVDESVDGPTIAPTGTLATMKRLLEFMRPLMPIEIRAIVCGTLGHLCSIGTLICGSAAILGVFIGDTSLSQYWRIFAATAVVMALMRGPLAYGEQFFNHQMAFSALRDIRNTVFDKMRSLAPAVLAKRGRGNLVTVITHDIELLEIFYAHTLSPIAIAIFTAVINTIVIFCLNPFLGLFALVCYLTLLIVPALSADPNYQVALEERNAQGSLHTLLLESLEGRSELIGLGAASNTRKRLNEATDTMLDARNQTGLNAGWNNLFTQIFTLLAFTAFCIVGIFTAFRGQISFQELIIAFVGFAASFAPITSVARLSAGIQPTLAAAKRVFSLLDEKPAVTENTDGTAVASFTGINAQDLSFSYSDQADNTKPILNGISFDIQPGTVVGVQGDNGSGKTTLIDLLMHFRERSGGQLTISDQPIESIRTADLRNLETLVSQDTFIFSQSLAENIAIARPDASTEEIVQAAQQARLDDVIAQLPDGLEHVLSANGSELSEGQKQRVAVARAFLSQAPFLALDEPTSNMDALLEGKIIDALVSNQQGKTYLIVSHRPAVLAHAQKLLTLSNGQLTED